MIALMFLVLLVIAVVLIAVITGLAVWLGKRYSAIWSYVGAGLLGLLSLLGASITWYSIAQAQTISESISRGYYQLFAIVAAIPTVIGCLAMLGLIFYGLRRQKA